MRQLGSRNRIWAWGALRGRLLPTTQAGATLMLNATTGSWSSPTLLHLPVMNSCTRAPCMLCDL